MRNLILNTLLFIIFSFALGLISLVFFFKFNNYTLADIPAPNFSESYSFNDKIAFLENKNKNVDIIAIGSSISLNNLDSKSIVNHFSSESFLNLSSWGMCYEDIFWLLKLHSKYNKPKKLIIASGTLDFYSNNKVLKKAVIENFLYSNNWRKYSFLRYFNLQYYLSNLKVAHEVRSSQNNYATLIYDKYGTANLIAKDFKVLKERWNGVFNVKFDTKEHNLNYIYLDSIAKYCNSNNIRLYFFQTPIRIGVFKVLSSQSKENLKLHNQNISRIIKKNKHCFIDSNSQLWPDSLFADAIHLKSNGAKEFTKFCLERINK